jgi:FKBP-type peptidyl-prolyl cis-trans isomerase FklB
MRHFILVLGGFLLALPLFGQEKSPQLKDWKDRYSYNIGMQLGSSLREKKEDLNPDIVAAGIKDAITLSDDQVKDVMAHLQKDMAQRQKELGEKNKTDTAQSSSRKTKANRG